MPTITTKIQGGATLQVERRVKVAKFGDGYAQRQVDGINPIQRTWNVRFIKLTNTEAAALESTILASLNTSVIDWQAPDETTPTRWLITSYGKTCEEGLVNEIAVTFVRLYGP